MTRVLSLRCMNSTVQADASLTPLAGDRDLASLMIPHN
jgi:hypothetical protein